MAIDHQTATNPSPDAFQKWLEADGRLGYSTMNLYASHARRWCAAGCSDDPKAWLIRDVTGRVLAPSTVGVAEAAVRWWLRYIGKPEEANGMVIPHANKSTRQERESDSPGRSYRRAGRLVRGSFRREAAGAGAKKRHT